MGAQAQAYRIEREIIGKVSNTSIVYGDKYTYVCTWIIILAPFFTGLSTYI